MADVVKTRGRKAIELTVEDMQAAILLTEETQPDGKFPNRSALWAAIEASEWAKTSMSRPLTSQVAMLFAKKHNLVIQTPVGKRGRSPGQGPVNTGPREKRKVDGVYLSSMITAFPTDYEKIVRRAANGSLKAAIKLKCLDCCGCEKGTVNTHSAKKEVSLCVATECSLWGHRPYKHKETATAEGRKRISLGVLDAKGNDNEESDSTGTVV